MSNRTFEARVIEPRQSLAVAVSCGGERFEVFRFKYMKNGDFLVFCRVRSKRVGHGAASWTDGRPPNRFPDVTWADHDRKYVTLHPSRANEFGKDGAVVNGAGGIRAVGIDLRTVDRCMPVMTHRLTYPDAYPAPDEGRATLHFGEVYARGAPAIVLFVTPLDENMSTVGNALPVDGFELIIEPSLLTERRFLLQMRLDHDATILCWPQHMLSFPIFGGPPQD